MLYTYITVFAYQSDKIDIARTFLLRFYYFFITFHQKIVPIYNNYGKLKMILFFESMGFF